MSLLVIFVPACNCFISLGSIADLSSLELPREMGGGRDLFGLGASHPGCVVSFSVDSEASVMSGVMELQSAIGHAACGMAACYYADALTKGR